MPTEAAPPLRDLPPGQRLVAEPPVMHLGDVPAFDPNTWGLLVEGEVEHPLRLAWRDVLALPRVELRCDLHGATGWTCRDLVWEGVPLAALTAACAPPFIGASGKLKTKVVPTSGVDWTSIYP